MKNHNYSTPPEGTTDWHLPLNDNFEALDADVEIRDTEASLSEYAPKTGAKFMATDTGATYLGDGSTWLSLPWTGSRPALHSLSANAAAIGEAASVGAGNRPLISNMDQTIQVPDDVPTIQAALDKIPVVCRHNIQIRVASGTYDEDLVFHPTVLGDASTGGWETGQIGIRGDKQTPSNVRVNSMLVTGTVGKTTPYIRGFELTGANPYDDENVALAAYGCGGNVLVSHVHVAGDSPAKSAFMAYSSDMTVGNCDVADGQLKHALYVKHNGSIQSTGPLSGSVTGAKYVAGGGQIMIDSSNNSLSGGNPSTTKGFVYDVEKSKVWGIKTPAWAWHLEDSSGETHGVISKQGSDAVELQTFPESANGSEAGTMKVRHEDRFQVYNSGELVLEESDTHGVRVQKRSLSVDTNGFGIGVANAEDLSGKTGNFDGEIRMDDGTNTVARMTPCTWDGKATVWRPQNEPDNGSFA